MTAQEQMKKMLDELMGTKRDGGSLEDGAKFTDPGICKSFLMGLCPYDLFHNTVTKKLDLGPCHKYHSSALKADFEQASKDRDYGYDIDQLDYLTSFVGDCDKKVEVNKKRLEDNQNDENDVSTEATSVHVLNEKIGKMLAESETLGADGKVEESLALMKEVDELKVQKRRAEDIYRNSLPVTATQQQKLRVCEICGAYLSLYDNDRRLADHFGGKLHMGFIRIRERLAELQESVTAKREAREKERELRKKERLQEEEKEREKLAERSREKERERRRRSRSRSREGSRRRDRSRDRRRDRSRDRRRDSSRDRRRDRSRDRRRRDEDRHRDRRSDSRRDSYGDRYRSRDRSRSGDRRRGRRDSRERSRYRSRERSSEGDRYRSSDRSRNRSRERSRLESQDRSRDGGVPDGQDRGKPDGHDEGRHESRERSTPGSSEKITNDEQGGVPENPEAFQDQNQMETKESEENSHEEKAEGLENATEAAMISEEKPVVENEQIVNNMED